MVYTQADSNSWQTIKELLSFFLGFLPCLMSVQTDLLVPWCDFMKAAGRTTSRVVNTNRIQQECIKNFYLSFTYKTQDFSRILNYS